MRVKQVVVVPGRLTHLDTVTDVNPDVLKRLQRLVALRLKLSDRRERPSSVTRTFHNLSQTCHKLTGP